MSTGTSFSETFAVTTGAAPPSPRPRPPRPRPPPPAFAPAAEVSLPQAAVRAARRHTEQNRRARLNTDVGSKESNERMARSSTKDTGSDAPLFTQNSSFNVSLRDFNL